jgi:hypothetical protein
MPKYGRRGQASRLGPARRQDLAVPSAGSRRTAPYRLFHTHP